MRDDEIRELAHLLVRDDVAEPPFHSFVARHVRHLAASLEVPHHNEQRLDQLESHGAHSPIVVSIAEYASQPND